MSLTVELRPIVPAFDQAQDLHNDTRLADYYAKRPSALRSFTTCVRSIAAAHEYESAAMSSATDELCTLENYRGY